MRKKHNILIAIIFMLILFLGAWLRFSGVFTNSFSFTYDTGRDLLAVKEITLGKKISLIGPTTGKEGVFYGPFWYLFLTVPFFLSGGNPLGLAFFIALLGTLMIPITFIIGKKISGEMTGLIFSSLISFSPVIIGTSSQIWSPNVAPPLFMLLLFLFYKLFKSETKKNNATIFFIGILLGLIMDMAIVFGTVLILSVFLFLIVHYKKDIFKKELLLLVIGLLVIFSPKIIFEFRHNFLMTKVLLNTPTLGFLTFSELGLNILKRLQALNNVFIETISGHKIFSSILTVFCLVIILLNWNKLHKLEKNFITLIFVVSIVFVFALTFFIHEIWSHFFIGIPILYALFVSVGINSFYKYTKNQILLSLLLFPLFYILINPSKLYSSISQPLWEGNSAVYRNQLAVIDYIYKEANNKNFNLIAYTPAVHDFSWQYLFSWYGKRTYGYTPKIEKEKLFFVIIEPNFEKPFLLKNWLKDREDDGVIVSVNSVKGGIVVQKRNH